MLRAGRRASPGFGPRVDESGDRASRRAWLRKVGVVGGALVVASGLGGCCLGGPPVDPPFRTFELSGLDLEIELPGDWRGGPVHGAGIIFASGDASCSLTYATDPLGLPPTAEGAETFIRDRLAMTPIEHGPMRFGPYEGFAASGVDPSRPDRRAYFGTFEGRTGRVWTQLTTNGKEAGEADLLWRSIQSSLVAPTHAPRPR